ncbi:hypothetical protein QQF64_015577 [Cirrhinus molitorella]|uniref:Immunoglobulin V-set domain-containing protein n=1 Tax=Cirrhinus molitorella TaxID=172907 RepID=A0ABR3NW33_9TELE
MAVDHLFTFFILLLIANTGFSVDTSIFVQTGASVQLDIQTQEQSNINVFLVSVIDAVEAPVLTVNSNWSSSDSCTVSFTCRAHEIMINSSYQNNRCSPEEVTSHEINTLILNCNEKYIMCNHSNPVSWKEDRINIKQLCVDNKENEILQTQLSSTFPNILLFTVIAVGVIVFSLVGGLALYCMNKTDVKQADDTDYDDVETLTQKMTGDTWTTVTYYTHLKPPFMTATAVILMFVTMSIDRLLPSFILLLISNTGLSAEIPVFVQTGASVQLDIQTQELPEFDDLSWKYNESNSIVKYFNIPKKVKCYSSYKDRVDFNDKTFSLTLKNMQKTDSGLYRAGASAESDTNIVTYRVTVVDAVEAPVLTVNLGWSSNSCTANITCRSHDFTLNSTFVYGSCSPKEVTPQINTLILYCNKESIICNHSNPVSWKEDSINFTQLCDKYERQQIQLSINETGVKEADDTDYDDVETLTQKMTGDTWTTVTYCAAGHQTPASVNEC